MSETAMSDSFTMQYDAERTFPFTEDENGNITGYGHQDPVEFAEKLNEYEALCNGAPSDLDEQWDATDVDHQWVTFGADGEELHACDGGTPGAIPVTTLWGQR